MPDVWLGRINRGIEKLFNVKGGPTVVDIAHQVGPMYQVFGGVEDRYLQGWFRYGVGFAVTGGAAQFAAFQIRNPANSGIIIVLEKIAVFTGAAANVGFGIGAHVTDLTTIITTATPFDTRNNTGPVAIFSQTTNNANPTSEQILISQAAGGSTLDIILNENQELPILPGSAGQGFTQTAATQLGGTVIWRERALETSELI